MASRRLLERLVGRSVHIARQRGADKAAIDALVEQARHHGDRLTLALNGAKRFSRPRRGLLIEDARCRYTTSMLALNGVARSLAGVTPPRSAR